jgi:hypothetical protein
VQAVHLKAGENQANEDKRYTQLRRVLEQSKPASVQILAGDLNTTQQLSSYYTGRVLPMLREKKWLDVSGAQDTYNGWKRLKFDYIHVKPDTVRSGELRVDVLPKPGPNEKQGSDHTPVTVTLDLSGPAAEGGVPHSPDVIDLVSDDEDSPTLAAVASAGQSACASGNSVDCMVLTDVEGRNVTFQRNSDPNGIQPYTLSPTDSKTLKQLSQALPQAPVFFCDKARMSKRMEWPHAVLLMRRETFAYLENEHVTHEGAFGKDVAKVKWETSRISGYMPAKGSAWVAVWKFPSDLNWIDGYHVLRRQPLPVGKYPFYDDGWWQPGHVLDLPSLNRYSSGEYGPPTSWVHKMRTDLSKDEGVHYLQHQHGAKCAMISSHYFIDTFWDATATEKSNVIKLLKALYAVNMYAFACYWQHHAIVFYSTVHPQQLITPEVLAQLLTTGAAAVVEQCVKPKNKKEFRRWVKNYINTFGSKCGA